MTAIQYFWRHQLAEQVRGEGREEGLEQGRQKLRNLIFRILESRGLLMTDAVRERVEGCTDLGQLEVWAQRAVHTTDAAELIEEG